MASPHTVRDSAGIEIVENSTSVWEPGAGWRVDTVPAVRIGTAVAGDDVLYRVRDAIRLPDGRIVFANRGTHEIRAYDASGALAWTAGGEGSGPGEFRDLSGVLLGGDTLFAYDRDLLRMTLINLAGEPVSSLQLREFTGRTYERPSSLRALLPDGRFVFSTALDAEMSEEPRVSRDTARHIVAAPDGTFATWLPTGWWNEMFHSPRSSGSVVYGAGNSEAFRGERRVEYAGAEPRVRFGRVHGDVERIAVLPIERKRVDVESMVDRARELGADEAEITEFRRQVEEEPWRYAEIAPSHEELVRDATGAVWLRRFAMPTPEPEPTQWDVIDAEGRWLGIVALPTRFTPHQIGEDYVLGVWRTELDEEQVHLYRLHR